MEKKFCFSEQKTGEGLEGPEEGFKRANKGGRIRQEQQQQQPRASKAEEETESRQDPEKKEEKVQDQTTISQKKLLNNLASDYFKLARSIECRLCVPPSSGLRSTGGGERKAQQQEQPNYQFVDLYRRRMQYEKLGVPLTAHELISMDNYDRSWQSHAEAADDELPSQSQPQPQPLSLPLPQPSLSSQEQQQELEQKQQLQAEVDNESSEPHLKHELEQRRLPGGYRLPNSQECGELKQMCSCGQELYDQEYATESTEKIEYNASDFDQMHLPTAPNLLEIERAQNATTYDFEQIPNSTQPEQRTFRKYQYPKRFQPQTTQYKCDPNSSFPIRNEQMMDYTYRPMPMPHQPIYNQYESREPDCNICHPPPPPPPPSPPPHSQYQQPARQQGLRPEILQHIQDVDKRMLPQLSRPHELRRVKIECNLAERWEQQQKETNQLDEKAKDDHADDLETLLPPKEQREEVDPATSVCGDRFEGKSKNVGIPTPPVSSSSFESPFNLQPERINALLKAKPQKSCLKKSMNTNEAKAKADQQFGYEADYETQSDDSGSESTADGNPLTEQCSTDTLTDVWYRLGDAAAMETATGNAVAAVGNGNVPRLTGGLYSQVDKLKFKPIDKLEAGSAGTPILDEQGSRTASERTAYFANEFAKLTRKERAQDIELRMGQLRLLQATSDRKYRRYLKANGSLNWHQLHSEDIDTQKHPCPLGNNGTIQCPLLLNESLLGHFLETHLCEPGLELREIFERDRLLIVFNPLAFDLGKNVCMSVIAYGGFRDSPYSLPIMRYMPMYNGDLPLAYSRYAGHLPLFLLICRNRLKALHGISMTQPTGNNFDDGISSSSSSSASASRKVRFTDSPNVEMANDDEDVLALWVVSMELPQPIHVVMTVFNRRLDITRSSIMKVRSLNKSQISSDFMRSSKNYMRLSEQDMQLLTNNHTEPIYMEVSVREYAATYPVEAVSALY